MSGSFRTPPTLRLWVVFALYVLSLGRRKQITVKTMKSIDCHFAMMIARYNKYDLREILNCGKIKEGFLNENGEFARKKSWCETPALLLWLNYGNRNKISL